ncbi:hypothetical protein F2B00_03250 [Streptomyces parvus]|uniref:hypothetical protein n=1 Tax=Streptomyces parvus TaxID=66428 RepID=UPI001238FF3E|nr:hypothetical protein [Streptomyces parvus]KAA6203649.1 hypothetical protein F2B00_03250 [Streptomyces parvus]GGS42137.1 hypothetical protein GCM10010221_46310 [Streptomyces parvus]
MSKHEILSLYTWTAGACFRHPADGVMETAVVRELHPRSGPAKTVRACERCVLSMETEREQMARELGYDYEPGHAGAPFPP